MFARLDSLGLYGMDAYLVSVEVDVSRGMPAFNIVGLPDMAVREARDRVCSAIKNSGFSNSAERVTVNLAPADVRKAGSIYDLPIYLSLLCASNQIHIKAEKCAFIGELSLSGEIKNINGVLPMAIKAKDEGFASLFVPADNAAEASVVEGINIYGVKHVNEVLAFFRDSTTLSPIKSEDYSSRAARNIALPDFADVKGQKNAKRALEIAAAGGHNAIMIGPPGSGKSMLAKRLVGILPDMSFDEAIETTKLHSIAGLLPQGVQLISQRPFRSPHHTVSPAALSGGGSVPKPGEVSLAHNGVLFLDELPEFNRAAVEVLRQPIEDSTVTISRVNGRLTYPCSVMLVAAMNPCPCGYFGHPTRPCRCSTNAVSAYLAKVSGPLLDRIDLHIEVMPVEFQDLSAKGGEETSAEIKKRVDAARAVQQARQKQTGVYCNARLPAGKIAEICVMSDGAKNMLARSFERLGLSARAYDRILKVSRTIADMAGSDRIETEHIAEAIQYRSLDRKYWQRNG